MSGYQKWEHGCFLPCAFIRIFPILVLDLAELDELDMDTGIDYPWIGKMFMCTIHGAVHYSWIM